MATPKADIDIDRSAGDFSYPEAHTFDAGYGLTHDTIDYIVDVKGEPDWIREFRHKALDAFLKKTHADALGNQGPRQHRLREHPLLPQPAARSRAGAGMTCPKT